MAKRASLTALENTENTAPLPKLPRPQDDSPKSPLNFSSPASLFESLISPMKPDEFFSEYWEKKPLLIQRDEPATSDFYSSLFKLSDLKRVAGKKVYYGKDVNLCKCRNGKKVVLPRHGRASYPHLLKDFGSGKATIQFHQPQRFNDDLWHIMEKLESFFGTLVGSNVYITPPDSQGLPAHYDDVEVFILQLEGEKRWKLYNPTVPLAREYAVESEDRIGTPTHEFTLKPGDFLYFPRGVIHHANTPAGSSHSTHVTISTYQNNSWADYFQDVFPGILFDSANDNIELRRGIPRRLLMQADASSVVDHLRTILLNLASRLETNKDIRSCGMIRDFMASRLPPFVNSSMSPVRNGNETTGKPVESPPKLDSIIKLHYQDHTAITVDHVPNISDSATELMVYVYHSLKNERETHMMGVSDDSRSVAGLRFPLSHRNALTLIWETNPVCVKDLPLENDSDKVNLAVSLWAEGLLMVFLPEA
ncbi:ribosomal oxygenase 2 isoform X2 [Pelobates fuscus]